MKFAFPNLDLYLIVSSNSFIKFSVFIDWFILLWYLDRFPLVQMFKFSLTKLPLPIDAFSRSSFSDLMGNIVEYFQRSMSCIVFNLSIMGNMLYLAILYND